MGDFATVRHPYSPQDGAGCWFLTSGIQEDSGGVARYYRSDTKQNARLSTEITGYAVSALVHLWQRRSDHGYLDAAVKAGRFLTRTSWNPELNLFPFEYSPAADCYDTYFFDSGIIIRGLLALYRVSDDRELLEVAVRAGRGMAAFRNGPNYHPILQLPGKEPRAYGPQWSRQPGCYQLKSALAWHDLFKVTGDVQFRDWYSEAAERAIAVRTDFLPDPAGEEKTMDRLHAYCYFLEALLAGPPPTPAVVAVVEEGIERVSAHLRDIAPVFERSDVYAQLLRVRLLGHGLGIGLNVASASEEATRIERFQMEGPDKRVRGGFGFGTKQGEMLPFVNPVSTAFCMQALEMWQDHQSGQASELRQLI